MHAVGNKRSRLQTGHAQFGAFYGARLHLTLSQPNDTNTGRADTSGRKKPSWLQALRADPAYSAFGWLSADRALRMLVGAFVGVVIARQLGPANMGDLAYAVAVASLLGVIPNLGIDSVIRRELAARRGADAAALGTAVFMRLALACVCYLMLSLVLGTVLHDQRQAFLLGLACLSFFQPAVMVLDLWFQARQQPGPSVMAQSLAFMISAGARCYAALRGADLLWIVLLMQIEPLLAGLSLTRAYRKHGGRMREWRWDGVIAKSMFREALPLLGASMAIMIYHRIDQTLLPKLAGNEQAGCYAISVRLIEMTYFSMTALAIARAPELIRARKESHAAFLTCAGRMLRQLTLLGLLLSFGTAVTAPLLVPLLFGKAYVSSVASTAILAISLVFISQGLARQEILVAAGRTGPAMLCAVAGALTSIGMNLWLLPYFGANGAAAAFVAAQFVAVFVGTWFFPTLWEIARLQVRAFAPFRLR